MIWPVGLTDPAPFKLIVALNGVASALTTFTTISFLLLSILAIAEVRLRRTRRKFHKAHKGDTRGTMDFLCCRCESLCQLGDSLIRESKEHKDPDEVGMDTFCNECLARKAGHCVLGSPVSGDVANS